MNTEDHFKYCKGCVDFKRNTNMGRVCSIVHIISEYKLGVCPCSNCLIKVTCSETCQKWRDLYYHGFRCAK